MFKLCVWFCQAFLNIGGAVADANNTLGMIVNSRVNMGGFLVFLVYPATAYPKFKIWNAAEQFPLTPNTQAPALSNEPPFLMAKSTAHKKSKQGGKAKLALISLGKKAQGTPAKVFEAWLKKLRGANTVSLLHTFLTPSSAENNVLHKAAAAKENTAMMIPQPPSGSSVTSSRFNLQTAMHLEDNSNLLIIAKIIAMSSLKNKHAYAHKCGYFAEITNLGDVASDRDKDEEDDNDKDDEDREDDDDKDDGLEGNGGSSDTGNA
ncbi:hypothetical protein B0F90DRAFT_1672287 [Multifurca ochricompacta]|uniref:Uncharacterized protein n=1 Tax=Multifurca ochricompacta TaxID=376703 RepID=A0AAD4QE47_9AGAM|nr:hypothetical protein B0F90DRAFT_1672287 [Multifurca ochricompacta]